MSDRILKYDAAMVRKCMAGPNALLLTDELTQKMHLGPGMLVLDLGCGRGLSSVFLAKEYGVSVYAVDKNVYAQETVRMLKDIGMDSHVFPVQADAGALPIPEGTMDALVCVNAWHNFGMEAGFLNEKIRPVLKPGAEAGFVLLGRDKRCEKKQTQTESPAFWTMEEWKVWFISEGLEIDVCDQLSCTQRAWKEWMAATSTQMTEEEINAAKVNEDLALIRIVGHL